MNRQFIRQEGTGIRALACTEGCHDHPEERKYPDQCQDGQTRMYDKIRQFLSNAVLIHYWNPSSFFNAPDLRYAARENTADNTNTAMEITAA